MAVNVPVDQVFEAVWPGNTTPQAPAGDSASPLPHALTGFILYNVAASARYVRFFDKATAPTMGADLPKLVVPLTAGQNLPLMLLRAVGFYSGFWVSVTTGEPNNDNTAPSASDVSMNIFWNG